MVIQNKFRIFALSKHKMLWEEGKNIEQISRFVGSLCEFEKRRVFQLIGFADNKGDFVSTIFSCTEKTIDKAFRCYGVFTNEELKAIADLSMGEHINWENDKCMVIRVA